MHYDFIEIGTCDYDTEIQKADDKIIGASIDAMEEYLSRLPEKENVKKICVAIGEYDGTEVLYYLTEDTIKKYNLPSYFKGGPSLGKMHSDIKDTLQIYGLNTNEVYSQRKVPVWSINTLFNKLDVSSLSYLKLDIEAMDYKVLKKYHKMCEDNVKLYADRIKFETIFMNQDQKDDIIKTFGDKYVINFLDLDCEMFLNYNFGGDI